MIDRQRGRPGIVGAFFLIGVGVGLAASPPPAPAQQAPGGAAPDATAVQVVAKLRSACETETNLRGAHVQDGEIAGGTLILTGTIDRAEQRGLLEDEGRRLVDSAAAWKARIPGGVVASKLVVFPIRSELLPRLRRDLARAVANPAGRPGLTQQTRVDDLYFDPRGHIHVVGLCINQGAYLTVKNNAANPVEDPRSQISLAIGGLFKGYPLPPGVERKVVAHIVADKVVYEENPVRRLQRWANEARLDDVLFRDARFDGEGALTIDGFLAAELQRGRAAELLSRSELTRTYARPGGAPPAEPLAAVASMTVLPWRKELLEALQAHLARDANRGPMRDALRRCRVDRAVFVYPGQSGLRLVIEGIALRPDDPAIRGQIASGISDESQRSFLRRYHVQCMVQASLSFLPNPIQPLRKKVAEERALDGVRLDKLVFGPRGEPTFEGRWNRPDQAAALAAVVTPALTELTGGKVGGPVTWHLKDVPTDRVLRDLRRKAGAEFQETSLDRLRYLLPAENPEADPVLTLEGAAAADIPKIEEKLDAWLKDEELARVLEVPVVPRLTLRPGSLLRELRKRVAQAPALDGLQVRRCYFDEENALVVSGLQDHGGQADPLAELTRSVAAEVWRGPPPAVSIPANAFKTQPLGPLLDYLRLWLPYDSRADKVLLQRAYYDEDAALVFAGLTTGRVVRPPDVEELIKLDLRLDPNSKDVKVWFAPHQAEPQVTQRTLARAIPELIGGNLAGFDRDELDRAILNDPSSSTAWYIRGAYYHFQGKGDLANRDFLRVKTMEKSNPGRRAGRFGLLVNFQGAARAAIEDKVDQASDPR